MSEETTVRQNLMNEPNYSPYCGAEHCSKGMPRTKFNTKLMQFTCPCGWVSSFPAEFIEKYTKKWGISHDTIR